MRPDMFKVIVERERHNSSASYKAARARERRYEIFEDDGALDGDGRKRAPMRSRGVGGRQKDLNENLKPLENFLRSACGRPWNKVYSEVREHLSPDSAVQMHVIQHLRQYVQTSSSPPARFAYHEFFVDRHGILRQANRERHSEVKRRVAEKPIAPDRWVAMIDGIWYELRVRALTVADIGLVHDAVFGDMQVESCSWVKGEKIYVRNGVRWLSHRVGGSPVLCLSRRQLGKRELALHQLKNDRET